MRAQGMYLFTNEIWVSSYFTWSRSLLHRDYGYLNFNNTLHTQILRSMQI